jgi:hypothetical protein
MIIAFNQIPQRNHDSASPLQRKNQMKALSCLVTTVVLSCTLSTAAIAGEIPGVGLKSEIEGVGGSAPTPPATTAAPDENQDLSLILLEVLRMAAIF